MKISETVSLSNDNFFCNAIELQRSASVQFLYSPLIDLCIYKSTMIPQSWLTISMADSIYIFDTVGVCQIQMIQWLSDNRRQRILVNMVVKTCLDPTALSVLNI